MSKIFKLTSGGPGALLKTEILKQVYKIEIEGKKAIDFKVLFNKV